MNSEPKIPLEYARRDPRARLGRPRRTVRRARLTLSLILLAWGIFGTYLGSTGGPIGIMPVHGTVTPAEAARELAAERRLFGGCCSGIPAVILGTILLATSFEKPRFPAPWSQLPADRLLPRMALWRHQIARGRANVPPSNLKRLKVLRVLFDGQCIGGITGTTALPDRFFGYLVPGADFERHRPAFDEVWQWSRRFEDALSVSEAVIDDAAWECYVTAVRKITDRIALPELGMPVETFRIDHYLTVEVRTSISANDGSLTSPT